MAKKETLLNIEARIEQAKVAQKLHDQKSQQSSKSNAHSLPRPLEEVVTFNNGRNLTDIERTQMNLFESVRAGRFECVPLYPRSEFPTLLTRVPIFLPGHSIRQQQVLDKDNALQFSTSWGKGRRHGPPLTTYDEDTLIAIGLLRQWLLRGNPNKFPIKVSPIAQRYSQPVNKTHVHVVTCRLSDIQKICGGTKGGNNNELRLASIKRLAATSIEITKQAAAKTGERGTTIRLIDVAWEAWEENAIFYIQISPILAQWLEKEFTYIDWEIRCQLSGLGKALHRFLSGQPKIYAISILKLKEVICSLDPHKEFTRQLRTTLNKMTTIGWLKSWDISGNARQRNQKLSIRR